MRLLKSMFIAFSMFSKIPVPHTKWDEKDMEYMFIFFPVIGLVIAGFIKGWIMLCERFSIGDIPRVLISAAIPLIITGGIHMDGYMDTMDAFHSYKPREEKLKILKASLYSLASFL